MGRKLKKGLDFFPIYHDFFVSKDIKALRRAHGHVGILTYLNILCRVYDKGYYYKFNSLEELSMDIAEEIANTQLRQTATRVTETIYYLVGRQILDEELFKQGVISGQSLQEQYVISTYKAKRIVKLDVYKLVDVSDCIHKNSVSSEEMSISSEEITVSLEESTQREEEGKVKYSFNHSIARAQEELGEVAELGELMSSPVARRNYLGGIGEGRVLLSDEQMCSLLERISLDEFNKYVAVVADCEKRGKRYKKKTHYDAILSMALRDRRI